MTTLAPHLTSPNASSFVHRTPRRNPRPVGRCSLSPSPSPAYTCSYPNCGMEMYSHVLLRLHEKSHASKDFRRAIEYELSNGDVSRKLICTIQGCFAVFDRQYEFTRHQWTHIPRAARPRCAGTKADGTPCDYLYAGRTDLMKRHWASRHEGEYTSSPNHDFYTTAMRCEKMGIELIPNRASSPTTGATPSSVQEPCSPPEDKNQWALNPCAPSSTDPFLFNQEQDLSFSWLAGSIPASNGFDMAMSGLSDFNWLNPCNPFDVGIAFA